MPWKGNIEQSFGEISAGRGRRFTLFHFTEDSEFLVCEKK